MKSRHPLIQICLLGTALLALPAAAQGQLGYSDNGDGTATITGYNGPAGALVIPNTINGLLVTGISGYAFFDCINPS